MRFASKIGGLVALGAAIVGCSATGTEAPVRPETSESALGTQELTCTDVSCPAGYACEMSSGKPLCANAHTTTGSPTCSGAVCPAGYHCTVASGEAVCYADDPTGSGATTRPPASGDCTRVPTDTCPAGQYCRQEWDPYGWKCHPGVAIPSYTGASGGFFFPDDWGWTFSHSSSKDSCEDASCETGYDCVISRLPQSHGGGTGAVCWSRTF